jgi:hypothetical protein
MTGKPTEFPMPPDVFDALPTHAKDHLPPATFEVVTTLAAPQHATGPGEHYAPQATVDLPDAAADGIAHASIPDWVLI